MVNKINTIYQIPSQHPPHFFFTLKSENNCSECHFHHIIYKNYTHRSFVMSGNHYGLLSKPPHRYINKTSRYTIFGRGEWELDMLCVYSAD